MTVKVYLWFHEPQERACNSMGQSHELHCWTSKHGREVLHSVNSLFPATHPCAALPSVGRMRNEQQGGRKTFCFCCFWMFGIGRKAKRAFPAGRRLYIQPVAKFWLWILLKARIVYVSHVCCGKSLYCRAFFF